MSLVISAIPQVTLPVVGTLGRFPVRRVYCVGRNYVEHAKEMGFTGREPPFFFLKPADAVLVVNAGESATVPYPVMTKDYQHEIEMVVAIGTGGKNIKAADAHLHIYGYAVGLDMTRRDLQGEQKKLGSRGASARRLTSPRPAALSPQQRRRATWKRPKFTSKSTAKTGSAAMSPS